jgi:hypothetical protein
MFVNTWGFIQHILLQQLILNIVGQMTHPFCTTFISGLVSCFLVIGLLKCQGESDSQLNQSTGAITIIWEDLNQRPSAVPPSICLGFNQCSLVVYLMEGSTSITAIQSTHQHQ